MTLEEVKPAKELRAVKPEMKVTGVSFSGYSTQYNGKERARDPDSVSEEKEQTGSKDSMQGGIIGFKQTHPFLTGVICSKKKKTRRSNRKRSAKQKECHVAAPAENRQEEDLRDSTNSGKTKEKDCRRTEKDRAYGDFISKEEYSLNVTQTSAGAGLDRQELIRKCGICERENGVSSVKPINQRCKETLADGGNAAEEPTVCSIEERERLREQSKNEERRKADSKQGGKQQKKTETGTEKQKDERKKKSKKKDKIKKELLRDYLIENMIHEEGRTDPDSHRKLISQMIKYDVGRILRRIGKLLWKVLKKVLLAILPLLLIAILITLPILGLLFLFMNPISYFNGMFDEDDYIRDSPAYVKNAVAQMYEDFYGRIGAFSDQDGNNQVEYRYKKYSNSEEAAAVYLAQICSAEDYGEAEEDNNYPPYLLIDTWKEQKLLERVFWEFNCYEIFDIELTVTGEDGRERQVMAQRMEVSCLTVNQWELKYASELSEKERKLLETLLERIGISNEAAGSVPGSGGGIPISDLEIPEGVDENLIYMAGFLKAEAGNQPYQGKLAVAYVMLNRAGGPSGNVKGVLTAPYQFSCYIPYHTVERYLQEYAAMPESQREQDACWISARAAYYGTAENPIGDIKYYCNPNACSIGGEAQWERIRKKNTEEEIIRIGDHVFCKNCW